MTGGEARTASRGGWRLRSSGIGRVGFGAAALGGLYAEVSDEEAERTLETAWRCGLRYFDVAPHYGAGRAERRLGAFLSDLPRHEFAVSTKVGRLLVADGGARETSMFAGEPALRRVRDYSATGVRRSLTESLERTGLDRFDLVLIHDPDDFARDALDHAYPELERLRSEGVVRAIGVGMNHTPLLSRFVSETDIDAVLVAGRYSLLDRTAGTDLLPACARRGVDVIVGGVFNSGILADPRPGATFDYAPAPEPVLRRARRLAAACRRWDVPLVAAALRFPLRDPAVSSVLVGMRSAREVRENVDLLATPVPAGLWAELDAIASGEAAEAPGPGEEAAARPWPGLGAARHTVLGSGTTEAGARPGEPVVDGPGRGGRHGEAERAAPPADPPAGRVDAHHHVWRLGDRPQPWIDPVGMAAIHRDFTLGDLRPVAEARGVTATVLVQTVPDPGETEELLALADSDDLVSGVVGWVDLAGGGVADELERLRGLPGGRRLVGVRHGVQDEVDERWLCRPEVRRGLRAVADAGLVFDLLTLPRQLPAAVETVSASPDLTFVLDHLSKPAIARGAVRDWESDLRRLARSPNVCCKLSGLVTEADHERWSVEDLRPYVTVALDAFGPHRVLFGSDWPVCLLAAEYGTVVATAEELTRELGAAERAAVFGGTARRVYGLGAG
ncbi:aldo/keto reductase [Actinoalloteichus caeruleus]|uniref:aldo/keto reductase n=1 Tax=Actinoalloteichus cyanogriseus TaxID=2893586 RepID=UPI003BB95290